MLHYNETLHIIVFIILYICEKHFFENTNRSGTCIYGTSLRYLNIQRASSIETIWCMSERKHTKHLIQGSV